VVADLLNHHTGQGRQKYSSRSPGSDHHGWPQIELGSAGLRATGGVHIDTGGVHIDVVRLDSALVSALIWWAGF
jgi:hypothetical protein